MLIPRQSVPALQVSVAKDYPARGEYTGPV